MQAEKIFFWTISICSPHLHVEQKKREFTFEIFLFVWGLLLLLALCEFYLCMNFIIGWFTFHKWKDLNFPPLFIYSFSHFFARHHKKKFQFIFKTLKLLFAIKKLSLSSFFSSIASCPFSIKSIKIKLSLSIWKKEISTIKSHVNWLQSHPIYKTI